MNPTRAHLLFAALCGLILATAGPALEGPAPGAGQDPPPGEKDQEGADKKPTLQDKALFRGALLCRNCHRMKEKGAQFFAWEKTPHPDAFQTLASPRAKEVAAARGIADPQKAPECLRCHVTAWGQDEKRIDEKTFKVEMGVQCESCHGPGGEHITLRSRELARSRGRSPLELVPTVPGEISLPTEKTCVGCHNPESPTYKPYKHKEFLKKVAHPNPLRPRHRNKQPAPEEGESGE